MNSQDSQDSRTLSQTPLIPASSEVEFQAELLNLQEIEISKPPEKRRSLDQLPNKQILHLYRVYCDEYLAGIETYDNQKKKRPTICSMSKDLGFKKSTVFDYFSRFKTNSEFLTGEALIRRHRLPQSKKLSSKILSFKSRIKLSRVDTSGKAKWPSRDE